MTPTRLALHVSLALAGTTGAALAQELTVEAGDAPPTAPAGLTANPYSGTAAGVIWERSTDDVRVAGYEVTLDGEVVQQDDTRTWVDFDLAPATTYSIGVTAIDSAGQRSDTAFVEFDTLGGGAASGDGAADASGPAPVQGLRANVYSTTGLGLIWTRPSGVGPSYEVSRDGEVLDTVDGVTYVDTGLTPGDYVYDVVAIDADGNRSEVASVEVSTAPGTADADVDAGATDGDADGDGTVGTATPVGDSVLDLARGTDDDGDGTFEGGVEGFDVLLGAVGAYPELVDLLDDETAELTVFAPTDEAFEDVDLGALDADDLENVLRYHVVSGTVLDTMALDAGTTFPLALETVQGGTLEIVDTGDGSLAAVDSAGNEVALGETLPASNGVVYAVDAVLAAPPAQGAADATEITGPTDADDAGDADDADDAGDADDADVGGGIAVPTDVGNEDVADEDAGPGGVPARGTLLDALAGAGVDATDQPPSTLVRLLGGYPDLVELLGDETARLTVLAPSDEAFAALDLGGLDVDAVRDVLAYHVVTDTVLDEAGADVAALSPTLTTAQGGTLQVVDTGDGGLAVIDGSGATVALGTIVGPASNGVAYVIDTVLTPPVL